ncbi:MAG: acyltransferase family protein [Desulfobacterales bacterium]
MEDSVTPTTPERRYDIDWLRLIAVFLLFFFHTARIFSPGEEFYAHNDPTSSLLNNLFIQSLNPWHMPIFFLLAGASTWYALRKRSGSVYVKERFTRLFVPFIFGLVVLIAPQSYIGLLNHSDYSRSYIEWYPNFFLLNLDDMDAYFLGGHTWGHLWFIFHLFVYSLVVTPLLLFLRRDTGKRFIGWLARICTFPGVILLFPLLLLPMSKGPYIAGGEPLRYITFFIYGYIIMGDSRFWEMIDRYRFYSLLLGPAVLILTLIVDSSGPNPGWLSSIRSPLMISYGQGFIPWFTIIACLAWGRRLLNFTNRFLKYFAEGAYALYILHQTVIVIIGYFVVQTDMAVGLKFVIILTASFISTILVYDLLIRRNNIVRFFFGMNSRR